MKRHQFGFEKIFQSFKKENSALFAYYKEESGEMSIQHQHNIDVLLEKLQLLNEKVVKNLLVSMKNEIFKQLNNENNHIAKIDGIDVCSIPISMKNAAMSLSDNRYGIIIGRNKLFRYLRILKYLDKNNIPYQTYVNDKLFKVVSTRSGSFVNLKTCFTQKGLFKLRNTILQCASDDMQLGLTIKEKKIIWKQHL